MPDGESSHERLGQQSIVRSAASSIENIYRPYRPSGGRGSPEQYCRVKSPALSIVKESSKWPSISPVCFQSGGRIRPSTLGNSLAPMQYVGRINRFRSGLVAHACSMRTFSSRKPIKFRKEISMCSRRNMSWTTALIATYGRRADNESARQFRYAPPAHNQERKRVTINEGLFPRRRCDRSCKSFASARRPCAGADECAAAHLSFLNCSDLGLEFAREC